MKEWLEVLGRQRICCSSSLCPPSSSLVCVGIGIAEAGDDPGFAPLHETGIVAGLVIVALKMQHAVHDEMRIVRGQCLALSVGFARDYRRTQGEIAFERATGAHHEREHVSRVVPAAKPPVESPPLPAPDDA